MQSKLQSMIETLLSVAIGFSLALALQLFLAWKDAMPFTFWKSVEWTVYFTILSILRGYYVRRLFNWLYSK